MKPVQANGFEADPIYREHILDHYKNPKNSGRLDNAEYFYDLNPLCGDEIEMFMQFSKEKIKDIKFISQGCAISQASASILSEDMVKKSIGRPLAMNLKKMQSLLGIRVAPARIKCMMLPLKVMKTIVYLHKGKKLEEIEHD